jgi:D-alanine-D-alanine ligase-like ATP-grasp enzyme
VPRSFASLEFGHPSGVWRELATRAGLASSTGAGYALRRAVADIRHTRGDRLTRRVAEEIWTSAAAKVGATLEVVQGGFFEISRGNARTIVYEQLPPLNDEVSIRLGEEKALVYALLRRAGVPVPEHLAFGSHELDRALAFLERQQGPCVIKPAAGSSKGFGVTSQLREPTDVRRAARWAARFSDRLLIERQIDGDVYRVLVLDGRVLDVVRRRAPSVVGDGRSSVAQLVEREYERRIRVRGMEGAQPLVIDLDSVLTLRQAGWTPRFVPAEGQLVQVKTVTNQNRREDNETVHPPLPSELSAAAVRAASTIGLRLAGIDLVTPDATRPLAESGGVALDVNARPGPWHHYRVRDPARATDVAAEILAALL